MAGEDILSNNFDAKKTRFAPRNATRGKKVLFICTHNSARSQMAEGLLNHLASDLAIAKSAGTEVTRVNPLAIKVMNELGIDISHHRSKSIREFINEKFDVVITVCDHAKETCPFFPGKRVLHASFENPSACNGTEEECIQKFREIRDQIKDWIVKELIPLLKNDQD